MIITPNQFESLIIASRPEIDKNSYVVELVQNYLSSGHTVILQSNTLNATEYEIIDQTKGFTHITDDSHFSWFKTSPEQWKNAILFIDNIDKLNPVILHDVIEIADKHAIKVILLAQIKASSTYKPPHSRVIDNIVNVDDIIMYCKTVMIVDKEGVFLYQLDKKRHQYNVISKNKLLQLNQQLSELEKIIMKKYRSEETRLQALIDCKEIDYFEIDVKINYSDDDNNIATATWFCHEMIATGENYNLEVNYEDNIFSGESYCWLFHDLYDHMDLKFWEIEKITNIDWQIQTVLYYK